MNGKSTYSISGNTRRFCHLAVVKRLLTLVSTVSLKTEPGKVKLTRSWSWFRGISGMLIFGMMLILGMMLIVEHYLNQATKPLPPPIDEATRRAVQRERIAEDLKQIGHFYKAYCAEAKKPTSGGFWTYLETQDDARAICGLIKLQQYAVQVPKDGTGIVGYERDPDLNDTHVIVMADGSVNKAMPEAEFQEAIKKGTQ
jgi:hypothetical protein